MEKKAIIERDGGVKERGQPHCASSLFETTAAPAPEPDFKRLSGDLLSQPSTPHSTDSRAPAVGSRGNN